ncbi:MAG: hypothetical protein AABY07_00900 [Nanoarchaeota archaeon]
MKEAFIQIKEILESLPLLERCLIMLELCNIAFHSPAFIEVWKKYGKKV